MLHVNNGFGACNEHFQGDTLRIKECDDSEQLARIGAVYVKILNLRHKCGGYGFVFIVGQRVLPAYDLDKAKSA